MNNRYEKYLEFLKSDYAAQSHLYFKQLLPEFEKADKENALKSFIVKHMASPNIAKQLAIALIANLYGASNPGFSERLNALLKELACGSSKQFLSVFYFSQRQLDLQGFEVSLINFVDSELVEKLNRSVRRFKIAKIAIFTLLICVSAIAMPGFTMIGLIPFTLASIFLFVYSLYKFVTWITIPKISKRRIDACARPIGECVRLDENGDPIPDTTEQ